MFVVRPCSGVGQDNNADEAEASTGLSTDLSSVDDGALLDFVRRGNADAYEVLFQRYRQVAHRLAAYLSNPVDAKDIVSECFTQVLHQLREGRGPRTSFRGYLFNSIRHEAGRRAKATQRVRPTDESSTIDMCVPFGHGRMDGFERDLVVAAFTSLPERWRTVLWHVDVNGEKPQEVAPLLGLKPNGVSALALRAREGLRRAYLHEHINTKADRAGVQCVNARRLLAGHVRGTASARDEKMIDAHLDKCAACVGVCLELEVVNAQLGAIGAGSLLAVLTGPIGPSLLGGWLADAVAAAKSSLVAVGSTAAMTAAVLVPSTPTVSAPVTMSPPHHASRTTTVPNETVRLAVADVEPDQQMPSESAGDDETSVATDLPPVEVDSSSLVAALPSPLPTSGATRPRYTVWGMWFGRRLAVIGHRTAASSGRQPARGRPAWARSARRAWAGSTPIPGVTPRVDVGATAPEADPGAKPPQADKAQDDKHARPDTKDHEKKDHAKKDHAKKDHAKKDHAKKDHAKKDHAKKDKDNKKDHAKKDKKKDEKKDKAKKSKK